MPCLPWLNSDIKAEYRQGDVSETAPRGMAYQRTRDLKYRTYSRRL